MLDLADWGSLAFVKVAREDGKEMAIFHFPCKEQKGKQFEKGEKRYRHPDICLARNFKNKKYNDEAT